MWYTFHGRVILMQRGQLDAQNCGFVVLIHGSTWQEKHTRLSHVYDYHSCKKQL